MLTFEYGPDNCVEIGVDAQGIQDLLEILQRLSPGDHEHLLTESWGGYPLSEEFPNADLVPIHKVTIQWYEPA
jgi:hypothetical protein